MAKKIKDTGIIETLTPSQFKAANFVGSWLQNKDEPFAVLKGFPGSGKTYTCRAIAEIYSSEVFVFSAPTNKAAQVLQLSLGDEYYVTTIHSLLGLRPNSASREKELVQTLNAAKQKLLFNCTVLVIDEASMIDEKGEDASDNDDIWDAGEGITGEVMDFIKTAAETYEFKVLYVGDKEQLPPPSSETGESPVFEQGYPSVEFTDVVRHDGAILDFSMAVREAITKGTFIMPDPVKYGIKLLRYYTANMLEKDLPDYLNGTLKMIAFTNKTVDAFNRLVRQTAHGENVEELQIGDQVLFIKPLFHMAKIEAGESELEDPTFNSAGWEKDSNFPIVASIDTSAEVVSITPKLVFGIPVYAADVRLEGGQNAVAYFLGQVSMPILEEKLKILERYIGSAIHSKDATRVYNHFEEFFSPIKFAYALTSHRAQGSTFKKVIVDLGDILKNRSIKTAFRSAYVAITRTQSDLRLLWRR